MAKVKNQNETVMTNYLLVDPATIKKGKNSRYFDHTEDAVMEKVKGFEKEGQLVPINCRRLPDKSLEVYAGFCRLDGALKYNELHPDKPMKIKVIVTEDNATDAFLKGAIDNRARSKVSVVDDAFTFKSLREDGGMKDVEISKKFNVQQSYVSRLKRLTGLRKKVLEMIHAGDISLDSACELAELDDVAQDEVLTWAEEDWKAKKEKHEEELASRAKDAALMPGAPSANGSATTEGTQAGTPAATGEDATAEPATPARKGTNPQPGGRGTRAPAAPQKSSSVTESVRKKRQVQAEKGEVTTVKAPTIAEARRYIEAEFCQPKSKISDEGKAFFGHMLSWLSGKDKMTDTKFSKVVKEAFPAK